MNSQAYNDFCEKRSNSYLNFIDQCRQKEKTLIAEQRKKCQVHHIVPRHHYKLKKLSFETFDLPENLVLLSFENHI